MCISQGASTILRTAQILNSRLLRSFSFQKFHVHRYQVVEHFCACAGDLVCGLVVPSVDCTHRMCNALKPPSHHHSPWLVHTCLTDGCRKKTCPNLSDVLQTRKLFLCHCVYSKSPLLGAAVLSHRVVHRATKVEEGTSLAVVEVHLQVLIVVSTISPCALSLSLIVVSMFA